MYLNTGPLVETGWILFCGALIAREKDAGVLMCVLNYENTRRLSGKYVYSLVKKFAH